MPTDWNPVLRDQFDEPYWSELMDFVARERSLYDVYPPADEVFAALHLTALANTRVVIIGQDPYHGPGQAHGLAFSVRHGQRIPPSLRNIHRELTDDLGIALPAHGNLDAWAHQGVLLLNTTLTVRAGEAGSHRGRGWEHFTDRVIGAVSTSINPVVFICWGAAARAKQSLIDTARHTVITSAHPSPLSAHNGFFGSRPFSATNNALIAAGAEPIDWTL
ncbi:MAG: uracil-DNA glycosylase [Ilumatobacteraceae bacterium]|nr:uracil-DNA glycosylase [Actinomycetota bacterium]